MFDKDKNYGYSAGSAEIVSNGMEAQVAITLRDYFAIKSLKLILLDKKYDQSLQDDCDLAYIYADAMMEARKS